MIGLRQRLLLLTLLPAVLLTILLASYFTVAGYKALDRELRERGLATVRYLAPIAEYGVLSGQINSLQAPLQAAVQQSAIRAALVVGRNGRILAVSGRVSLSSDILRRVVAEPALVAEGDGWIGFGAPIARSVAEVGDLFEQSQAEVSTKPAGPIGHVFIELDTEGLQEAQWALLRRGLLILLVGLALSAILANSVANNIAQPILRLLEAVRAMSAGQRDVRVATESSGEFGELERGFNEMAENIDTAHANLQERIELATADLVYQARHDSLTDLANRREFETRLNLAIEMARTGGPESAVLFIDLDRFKYVNDSAGHVAGDELLRQLSRQLQGRLREKDTLARIGGDEFSVLLPATSMADATQVAEDLCKLTERFRLPWNGEYFTVGASIGAVAVTQELCTVSDVLHAGDSACYEAKNQGRNRVVLHLRKAEESHAREEGARLHQRIRNALQNQTLGWEATTIMPIAAPSLGPLLVDLRAVLNDDIEHSLGGGLLEDFAERYGLSIEIDENGAKAAQNALTVALQGAESPTLMLPLSAASICDPATVRRLGECFDNALLQASGVCLMLGEEAVIRHLAEAERLARGLRELGFGIALSDFGSLMTSFNHLHVVQPQYVRLKSSLTRDLVHGQSATVLVRAVQEIAEDLGIATIAERVDDAGTLKALKTLGVQYGQGKMLGRPLPLNEWVEQAAGERWR